MAHEVMQNELRKLEEEFAQGDLTEKGYVRKKNELLKAYSTDLSGVEPATPNSDVSTIVHEDAEIPEIEITEPPVKDWTLGRSRNSSSVRTNESAQLPIAELVSEFSRRERKDYGTLFKKTLTTRNPKNPTSTPSSLNQPFVSERTFSAQFTSIIAALRTRSHNEPKGNPLTLLDRSGREANSISFEKLNSRAERVSQIIKDKRLFKKGDPIILLYKQDEIIEFMVALFGVFYSGCCAVPFIPAGHDELVELNFIIAQSGARLLLTSETTSRHLAKEMTTKKGTALPKIEIWKTTDFGTSQPKKKGIEEIISSNALDLAFVEYSKSSLGEIKGAMFIQESIHYQAAFIENHAALTEKDIVLSCLDGRYGFGLYCSAFFSVHSGISTCNFPDYDSPSSLLKCAAKLKATILCLSLQQFSSVIDYLANNDGKSFDLSSIRAVWIECIKVPLSLLRRSMPLLKKFNSLDCKLYPVITGLGGVVVSMPSYSDRIALDTVTLDAGLLRSNLISFTTERVGELWKSALVAESGPVLSGSTVAVVYPDNSILCPANIIGELWVNSPALPVGYWNLTNHTSETFDVIPNFLDMNGQTQIFLSDIGFVRTGLLGFVSNGKIWIVGHFEDQIRYMDADGQISHYYGRDLCSTIATHAPEISFSAAFSIGVMDQEQTVVLLETTETNTASLVKVGQRVIRAIETNHSLPIYCVLLCKPGTVPRIHNEHPDIDSCRKAFEVGTLSPLAVVSNAERAVHSLPTAEALGNSENAAIANGALQPQFSGSERFQKVADDITGQDLTSFSNISDLLIWRSSVQPENNKFVVLDRGKEVKSMNVKALTTKLLGIAQHFEKKGLEAGDNVLLFLTPDLDFVVAMHVCLYLGILPVTFPHVDGFNIERDAANLIEIFRLTKLKAIIVNNVTEGVIKKIFGQIKAIMKGKNGTKFEPPVVVSIKGLSASKNMSEMIPNYNPRWAGKNTTALVAVTISETDELCLTELCHDGILSLCRQIKQHNQVLYGHNILASMNPYHGLGLILSCFLGIYSGASTIIFPFTEVAHSPSLWLEMIMKYGVEDVYVDSYPLGKILDSIGVDSRGLSLDHVRNWQILIDDRADASMVKTLSSTFLPNRLPEKSISVVTSSRANYLVSSKGAATERPTVRVRIDRRCLREGKILLCEPDSNKFIEVIDSGEVPDGSIVAIVDPETGNIRSSNQMGEVWVASESNNSRVKLDEPNKAACEAIRGSDGTVRYSRTGLLGFLANAADPSDDGEVPLLFILGRLEDIVKIRGFWYFSRDIEKTVEDCCTRICKDGVALVKGRGLSLLVEIDSQESIFNSIPIIMNTLFEDENIMVDEIVFGPVGMVKRDCDGRKQRELTGRMLSGGGGLASWHAFSCKSPLVSSTSQIFK